jgi:UDP-glucose 4-epimerase
VRVLVIGSTGFIGGAIEAAARNAHHSVIGIGRSNPVPGHSKGTYYGVDLSTADLSDIVLRHVPDVVVYAAGTASVQNSVLHPLLDFENSVTVWARTLDAIRRSGIPATTIFLSSAAVYGNPETLPVSEEAEVKPISPYGFHKAACELLGKEFAACYGLEIISCRLFSVFGASQRRLLVWELFKQFCDESNEVWLRGTGNETRDFLASEDVANAVLAIAETRRSSQKPADDKFSVVNIGSGLETSVMQIALELRDILGSSHQIRARGIVQPGDPERWQADINELRRVAPGWNPPPLHQSLGRCVKNWQGRS